MNPNRVYNPAYVESMKCLKDGSFISKHQMLADLRESLIWFDRDHAESSIMNALHDWRNNQN